METLQFFTHKAPLKEQNHSRGSSCSKLLFQETISKRLPRDFQETLFREDPNQRKNGSSEEVGVDGGALSDEKN